MAINIRFDLAGNPEPPTIILANRNGNKLGQLEVDEKSIDLIDRFNDASEFTFTLNKYVNGKITNLWDKVVDFKLVYCKEWDMWFEIFVELDESTDSVKTVSCKQLGQAELSQIMLYNIEINTENDIARDDYILPTVLYRDNGYVGDGITEKEAESLEKLGIKLPYDDYKEASLLHRLLRDKAPHYNIAYVSPTIKRIQRTFSFDGTSIYDAFQNIAEEIGCIFLFPSNSDSNGKIQRDIFVYDLYQICNECGHRGEFTESCTKCGSNNITSGYGEDTLIFVTSDELASDGIQLTTDSESIKNCFKLEAGDDLMTATVRNCNPNGTDYIWRFSDDMKSDMSKELVEKIDSYNEEYQRYYDSRVSYIDENLISKYNKLIEDKNDGYGQYNKDLITLSSEINGYPDLMNAYYNTVDFALYLQSGLILPSYDGYLTEKHETENENDYFLTDESNNFLMYKLAKNSKTTAQEQANLLTLANLSPVAVANLNTVSVATLNSVILSLAKTIIKSTYKVKINDGASYDKDAKKWTGSFTITDYNEDEEDSATTKDIDIMVNDDYETFVKQKIGKLLSKEDTDDISVTILFGENVFVEEAEDGLKFSGDFYDDLKRCSLNLLLGFRESCQACIDILIEQGVGNGTTWGSSDSGGDSNLYEKLYKPYYNKLLAIESQIKKREEDIGIILGIYDSDGRLIFDGVQSSIEKCRNEIQDALDFQKYLEKHDLWLEFCSYRREDKYSNENYISDGLDNAGLFEKAQEFFEVATDEIYKSSETKYSISTKLNNLLAIPKFKSLVKYFKVGNWIMLQVDEKIYKLRLLEYEISFGDFDNISVDFSDMTKVRNGITDVENVLSQASSMASSYGAVQKQASQGEKSNVVLNDWFDNGLNATNTKIVGTDNQNQVWDRNGILCRQYDQDTGAYSDEQLKIINSTIAITDDNWKSTKTAIGKYYYIDPITNELKTAYGVNGETIVGKLILGENMIMQNNSGSMVFDSDGLTITSGSGNDVGTMTFDDNGLVVSHGKNTVTISPKTEEVMNITNGEEKVFNISEKGELSINGNIMARSLQLDNGVTIDSGVITNLSTVAVSGSYNDLLNTPTKLSEFTNDGIFITKDADNLTNYYKKSEIDSSLKSINDSLDLKANTKDLSTVATSGSYNDLIDINEFKNWVLEQIKEQIDLAINQ